MRVERRRTAMACSDLRAVSVARPNDFRQHLRPIPSPELHFTSRGDRKWRVIPCYIADANDMYGISDSGLNQLEIVRDVHFQFHRLFILLCRLSKHKEHMDILNMIVHSEHRTISRDYVNKVDASLW